MIFPPDGRLRPSRDRQPGGYEAQVSQRAIATQVLEHLSATDSGVSQPDRAPNPGCRPAPARSIRREAQSLLAIGLASLLGPDGALAGTLVEFPNLPEHTPANLSGYLARRRFGGRARQFFQRWRTVPGDCLGRLRGRAKCINLGHCTSGCAQGAKTRTDITYWSAAC